MRHISRVRFGLSALIVFLALAATPVLADAVPAQLAEARSAAEEGLQPQAVSLYGDFIAGHPLMQTVYVTKDERLPPSQVHDLLLAFAELTELQRIGGEEEARRRYLDKLGWLRRNHSISAINLYHLARVYLDNDRLQSGLEALQKITDDQERFPEEAHNKVYLRASARLLEIHGERGRSEQAGDVLARLERSLVLFNYDMRDRYKIGRLLLENGSPAKAEPILADIAGESDPSALRAEEFTIIRASVKLLGIYAERNDNRAIDRLLKELGEKYAERPLSPNSRRLMTLAMDRAGRSAEAHSLFEGTP